MFTLVFPQCRHAFLHSDFAQLRKPVIFRLHMNLSQDLAVWGYNLVKTTWISKKIKDEVEEQGISVNEVTKNAFVL